MAHVWGCSAFAVLRQYFTVKPLSVPDVAHFLPMLPMLGLVPVLVYREWNKGNGIQGMGYREWNTGKVQCICSHNALEIALKIALKIWRRQACCSVAVSP